MKRSLLAAGAIVVMTVGGATAHAAPLEVAQTTSGTFSVLTYNVAGLPEGLSSGNPEINTPLISPRLAAYDVVNVQEDFNYHAALYAGDNHLYRTPTSGGAAVGDGLNTLSNLPYTDFERVKWAACNGTDCLTPKGFTFARLRLAEGVYVDLYNAHPNASVTEPDLAARRANISQLSAYITANSASNAVIVMGDTNTRYTREGDNIRELTEGNGLTDAWVQLARNGVVPTKGAPALVCDPAAVTDTCEVVDKILYRGNRAITLTAQLYHNENAAFLDGNGQPLSDHYPHTARFGWSLDDSILMSDQFGGPHGSSFTDVDRVAEGLGVRSVSLRGGSRLDSVSLTRSDGSALSHGGTGGTLSTLALNQGENLVAITLSTGQYNSHTRVFSARLTTDQGRTLSAGQATGNVVTYTAPAGWRIAGFTGRSGTEIDKLGVIYLPR